MVTLSKTYGKNFYTITELARRLGVGRNVIYNIIKRERLPVTKTSKMYIVPPGTANTIASLLSKKKIFSK